MFLNNSWSLLGVQWVISNIIEQFLRNLLLIPEFLLIFCYFLWQSLHCSCRFWNQVNDEKCCPLKQDMDEDVFGKAKWDGAYRNLLIWWGFQENWLTYPCEMCIAQKGYRAFNFLCAMSLLACPSLIYLLFWNKYETTPLWEFHNPVIYFCNRN